MIALLSNALFPGLGLGCSSARFSALYFFGQSVWRAHTTHALRWPASETVIGVVMFSAADTVASVTSGREFSDARSGFPASAFGKCIGARCASASPPPNNSFKPTPCRGVSRVLCATLAHVRRPATGRLNSSVRRQQSILQFCFPMLTFPASVGTTLRPCSRHFSSSVNPSGALIYRVRCVGRLRKRCLVSVSAPLLTLSLLTGSAESSRVRVLAFPLRLSASTPGSGSHRHPPPPNNSFKPTPCRGVGHVLYATLAHVRRPATGRLNSGVRPHVAT